MVMDTVRIADLKARLSEYLRAVRRGRTLTVLDRDRPVARIVPCDTERRPLTVRSPRPGAIPLARVPLPPALRVKVDVLATALLWREHSGGDIVMATHDVALATAARACGLTVVGAA